MNVRTEGFGAIYSSGLAIRMLTTQTSVGLLSTLTEVGQTADLPQAWRSRDGMCSAIVVR